MKYIIQSIIEFNTTEYILISLIDSKKIIKLSNSAGRILEELIEKRNINTPVTREHLFSVVWRTFGLEPSHGNLNQQISLIRKSLLCLGLKTPPIITIPKRGLKINDKLIIKKLTENKPYLSSDTQINCSKNNLYNSTILLNFKNHIRYMILFTITIIIIFIIGIFLLHHKQHKTKIYCCKELNTCKICAFNTEIGSEHCESVMQCTEITENQQKRSNLHQNKPPCHHS
ncbi:winged helix-turn-helix domain-containing protein [Candidatus Blochmannia ocreatus (nom. nud.)]|uniref:Transcriptional regulator n=1 Tax=Candidatus Blochmannia ocreatus (nom. nud.) TaxID=251538 RepID=A0ABY4SVC4_9ENTR|nr:transcriptional regulator [Candidatus Blochmannia ocreatus]URJ24895.1 transcriptional regulator [Candidatus Blochmannia ocreatus]